MNKMKRFSALAVCFMCVMALMAQGMKFEPTGTTLEEASAKAKAENKLIFLDCFTTWCGPCKKMARDVFPQDKVGAYMNPKFINLQIDMEGEYGAPLAKKLQITAYPTFVIFNADAQEIGRFLGSSDADGFIKNVEEKSKGNSSSENQKRFENGDRDPQFLLAYLQSLNASYKSAEANKVAEALLDGKEATFAADSTLRMVFMRSVNNPFAKSFVYTVKNPDALKAQIGEMPVNMKIQNVLTNYQREIITEENGTATIDQAQFDKFVQLMKDLNIPNADHYRLSTLITLSQKQKDFDKYLGYIREYLANGNLDADDMLLARWSQPFTPETDAKYRSQMKEILLQRLADIKAGKRQPMTTVGNMRLSRPTDDLLRMIVDAMDGKMPNQ
ncbi:MAG: thioredoxin family protein [Bacteroidaceae bacterium]|nr:thioredoxin family protein [Bacteroidaceae bacterium]